MAQTTTKEFPLTFAAFGPQSDAPRLEQIPTSSAVLLVDRINAPATFIVLNFITKALKRRRPIWFLSYNHFREHWESLIQKQGIQSSLLQSLFKFQHVLEFEPMTLQSSPSDWLDMLSDLIKQQISELCEPGHEPTPLVIIDDISSLMWSGASLEELIRFSKGFYPIYNELQYSLVAVLHGDLMDDQENQILFNQLVHMSHVILRTSSLGGQGLGELTISRGPLCLDDMHLPVTISANQTTQYRIDDNSVTFYPKGLDRAFI
ncbi:hypothetical protein O181_008728 [Austropuccinia psidii MF-1]|uniref:Elongator complex protein 6 n=1 Tax=Austropuccinia psidii MF-1 TaxID=1389203 RepID=A0A9Q3GIS4_9BASI|nr:hypothetical protein [Austropuccinia psidii MF-1]